MSTVTVLSPAVGFGHTRSQSHACSHSCASTNAGLDPRVATHLLLANLETESIRLMLRIARRGA